MRPDTARRLLAWLFYGLGVVMTVAYAAVVMPTDWMAAIADRLGVGRCSARRSPST